MSVKSKLMQAGLAAAASTNIVGTVANNLSAAGTSQSTALLLSTDDIQIFTTVGSGSANCCVISPGVSSATSPYSAGDEITIVNHGGQTLNVYPQSGGKIANGSLNAAVTISNTKTGFLFCIDGTNWAFSVSA